MDNKQEPCSSQTLVQCQLTGNRLAAVLSGDLRKQLKSAYAFNGARLKFLDGFDSGGMSKFNYILTSVLGSYIGYNSAVAPDEVRSVGAVPEVYDLAALQNGIVVAWTFDVTVPLNTVTATSWRLLIETFDRAGNPIVREIQVNPCGGGLGAMAGTSSILIFPLSIQNLTPGIGSTCHTILTFDTSSIPIAQTGAAYAPGGVVLAALMTLTAEQGSVGTLGFKNMGDEDVKEVNNYVFDILAEGIVPTALGKVQDYINQMVDAKIKFYLDQYRGKIAPNLTPSFPALEEAQRKLIKMVEDSKFSNAYSYAS